MDLKQNDYQKKNKKSKTKQYLCSLRVSSLRQYPVTAVHWRRKDKTQTARGWVVNVWISDMSHDKKNLKKERKLNLKQHEVWKWVWWSDSFWTVWIWSTKIKRYSEWNKVTVSNSRLRVAFECKTLTQKKTWWLFENMDTNLAFSRTETDLLPQSSGHKQKQTNLGPTSWDTWSLVYKKKKAFVETSDTTQLTAHYSPLRFSSGLSC